MFEYEIMNNETKETTIIFGYSIRDAFEKYGYDENKYSVLIQTYVD